MNFYSNEESFSSHRAFLTLLLKEVRRFMLVWTQTLVTPILITSLYLFVFGAALGERISVIDGLSYAQFVIPGLILMGVINNSFANTSSSLFMSRHLGSIADLLVMPLSSIQIVAAYTLAGMLRGLLVGAVVGLISTQFAVLPWAHPLYAVLMAILASMLFSVMGLIAGTFAESFDGLSLYINFVILPLVFLGGVFYPISILPSFWRAVSQCNPLFYLLDGFRHALLGIGDIPLWLAFVLSGGLTLAMILAAVYVLEHSKRFRS
ncbi:MAG: ABC transporter permease [Desulfuromonadaceae bacterium]|nr:ABC transporter permease [Desulfuromonadaceae bacterium]